MYKIDLTHEMPTKLQTLVVTKPLPQPLAKKILLSGKCHVDHEGFDLNDIEQTYYANEGLILTSDDTWYKDGDGDRKSTAILQPWFSQTNKISYSNILEHGEQLILDHSHFVFRLPIDGEAKEQILQFVPQRPELLRLLSVQFKCGLDFCMDLLTKTSVQPIVHIEWDYSDYDVMYNAAVELTNTISEGDWLYRVPFIKEFNKHRNLSRLGAFDQADFRSMILFNDKSYKLIPTLYGN